MSDRDRPLDGYGRRILFPGTDQCADCGEPYSKPGLIKRCAKLHKINKAG